ncbi:uncharacterized protein LOC128923078 [Zeugodacus cucurbitae]|uniref:uncharacterized protein LOC128923078 n=1 Tax=Zeugodacus cucurbitae TaxID=28588 RepID=UPI0023D91243|nr:uncharacterized protein LOC128923078 [Zeugodacus cucurbitae]XP_054091454.1 uncharacterized protein LOC128923078 [Zeugodacus cucurbitae]
MDFDEALIEKVRHRPLLYDLWHGDYKNLRKKDHAWKEVAVCIKLSELECKKRWKSLRDCYKRCRRMEQVPSGSGAEVNRKKWKYLDAMSFLESATTSRRTISNVSYEMEYLEDSDIVIIDDSQDNSVQETRNTDSDVNRRKKKDCAKFEQFLDMAERSITESCARFVESNRKQNSTTLHFSSLAAKMVESGLPQNVINEIEEKVSNLVCW